MVRKTYSLAAFSIGLFVFACPHYGQTAAILPRTRQAIEDRSIRPFKVQVPQAALDDLRRRIKSTRWPDKETDPSQGVPLAKLQGLVSYWGSGVLIATAGLALHVSKAQQVGARRMDLQRHDLSVKGREVIQTIVELEPGTTAPRHSHPGEEIIYVIEGTWEYTVEGKPPVTLKAGDVLFIPAGTIHSARNVGADRGRELATYIVEKGKPLVVLAK